MYGSLPSVLLEEPYGPPAGGEQPGSSAPGTSRDGAIVGSWWTPDWRDDTFVGAAYQGYGGPEAAFASLGSATGWDPHTGRVDTEPLIPGYAGPLQTTTLAELRAGQTIAFPTSGQMEPGFDPILLEIPFDQGADVGWQQAWAQGRRMLFSEPLDYSAQTDPIPAAGWP